MLSCRIQGKLMGFCQIMEDFSFWRKATDTFVSCMALGKSKRQEIIFSFKKFIYEKQWKGYPAGNTSYIVPLFTDKKKIAEMKEADPEMKEAVFYFIGKQ